MTALPNEFAHFQPLNEQQKAESEENLQVVRGMMTDQALADLKKAGIVEATADKERACNIVNGILMLTKTVVGILK